MTMRKITSLCLFSVCCLLLSQPRGLAQEVQSDHGFVDFGVRLATGEVYGRPDLPFSPSLKQSQFNVYSDIRDGFYIRRADIHFDNVLHTHNYFSLQSLSSVYRDQSYLASFGNYGKFRLQFRYDEIPHIYSDTTRTLYTQVSPGVFRFPALIRSSLQASTAAALPFTIQSNVVPQGNFITPKILRKDGTLSMAYNLNSHWSAFGTFFRESQKGSRPIGLIMNSSPSASATAGFGMELPEPINYYTNWFTAGMEYGARHYVVQGGYTGSYFDNNIPALLFDNPFRLTTEQFNNPLTGQMALYPDNHANYLNFAAGTDLANFFHLTASITPGWLKQDQAFLPYTSNASVLTCGTGTQACNSLAVLPTSNLHGDVQTLAMNYTISTRPWKNITFKANYRQYDYNDNTVSHIWTPIQGDVAGSATVPPGTAEDDRFAFNSKDLEVSGVWFFAKHSSVKVGYEGLWMDRSFRDVGHSLDNSFFVAGDWSPIKSLLVRIRYRRSDRTPDSYQDPEATDPVTDADVLCTDTTTVFTADQRCHRRFDEAARILNRGDGLVQYTPFDKLTLSAFGGTMQSDYNQRGGVNSPTPLNFIAGTEQPYYLYGLQKDISYNYGFDADYALTPDITLYAEYSREHYYQRMITRYRTPTTGVQTILTCTGCDSANNDWESTATDPIDVYSAGADIYLHKKINISAYYTLSAGKGHVDQRFLGDPTITTGANAFQLIGTNSATNYPETVNRYHEVGFVLKYKLTDRLTPRFEYRYQQWDNKDYQTSEMTPYMGCISPIPNGPPVTNAVPGCTTPIFTSNIASPVPGGASPFYPGFVVGDPSAARFLFLGVDQPSYHAHIFTATLQYRF